MIYKVKNNHSRINKKLKIRSKVNRNNFKKRNEFKWICQI